MIKVAKRGNQYLINSKDTGAYYARELEVETVDGVIFTFTDKEASIGSEPKAFFAISRKSAHVGYEKDGEFLTTERWTEINNAMTANALWDDDDRVFVFNDLDEEYDYRKWRKGWTAKHEEQIQRNELNFQLYHVEDQDDMEYLHPVMNLDADSFGLYRVSIPVEDVERRVRNRFAIGGFTIDSTWRPEARANGVYWKFYLSHKVYNRDQISWTFQLHAVGPYADCIEWRDARLAEIDEKVDQVLAQFQGIDAVTKAALNSKLEYLTKNIRGFAPTYSAAQKKKSEYSQALKRLEEIRELLK